MTASTEALPYRERLWPAWWVLLFVAATVLMIAIAYGAAVSPLLGWVVGVLSTALAVTLIVVTSPVIEVSAAGVRWSRVHIPHELLGEVSAPTHSEIRDVVTLHNPSIRPFLAVRTWATPHAVLIALADETDPHTHVLLSTRHADRVTTALRKYRTQ